MKPLATSATDKGYATGGLGFDRAWRSFEITLRSEGRSPRTISVYEVAARQIRDFIVEAAAGLVHHDLAA